ncbi:hypothetical protein O9X94_19295 [Agrobacterium leguminum]|uniref:Uncharacterized protein n=1 Tax=Agrobacterium leguminum TaxID=2792015 RepID=A0A9X3KGS0_9HYPH|nr:hypothetical protein [Agrobacterium leguminum]MCZ7911475.1 hypothetical protein [Agrobacterium leguminum]
MHGKAIRKHGKRPGEAKPLPKVRKLEVELAHALACGATRLVAEGSRLSNATRAVAATAATLGLKCTLLLCHDEPHKPVGNLMLDGLWALTFDLSAMLAGSNLLAMRRQLSANWNNRGSVSIGCR